MLRRRHVALAAVAVATTAYWSWAATTWQLQTKLSTAGGTIQVRNKPLQTTAGSVVFNNFTTSAPIPVAVAASNGYRISALSKNGVSLALGNYTAHYNDTFSKSASSVQSLSASFAAKKFTVTGSVSGPGSITPNSSTVSYGSAKSLVVTPTYTNGVVTDVAVTGAAFSAPTLPATGSVSVNLTNVTGTATVVATVVPVTASAGADKLAATGSTVTLNGSASGPATSTWTQVSGPAVTLANAGTLSPSFTAATDGSYIFQLTESLGGTVLATSTTKVTVTGGVTDYFRNACNGCHAPVGSAAPSKAFGSWSSSGHKAASITCVTCHTDSAMPTPVNTATVNPTTFVITSASAGTVGTNYCAKCHTIAPSHGAGRSACAMCHTDIHNPKVAPFLTSTSAQAKLPVQKGDPAIAAADGYAGSDACRSCHNELFASWSNTLHNKPLKQLSETGMGVLKNKSAINTGADNDFLMGLNFNYYDGTGAVNAAGTAAGVTTPLGYGNPFAARIPNAPVLGWNGSNPTITIGAVTYEITRAHGGNGKWKQRYQTKIGGAYYVLNVQWDEMNGRYEEYNGQNWYGVPTTSGWSFSGAAAYTPIFASQATLAADVKAKMMKAYGLGKEGGPSNSSWDNRCTGCHQTGMKLAYQGDDTAGEVVAGYQELNVGCEACHGPGAAHVSAPAAANILQPQKAFVAATTPNYFKADEVCGQCHNRTEGAGHLGANGTTNLVNLPTESPSKENLEDRTSTAGYNPNSADRLNDFVEKYDPGVYGVVDNSGTLQYDGANFPKFAASNKHHQTFEEIQQGAHGAAVQSQAGHNKGLSCWSCHDPHADNSSNMKASINGVATNKDDNTLCLACHAGDGDFSAVQKGELNGSDKTNEWTAVNAHLQAKLQHTVPFASYLLSVSRSGATFGAFGNNTIKVGNCISCHMPLTAKSGIFKVPTTGDTAKKVGDIHNHTMKTVKASQLNANTVIGGAVNGKAGGATAATTAVVTSCSVCHLTSGTGNTNPDAWY